MRFTREQIKAHLEWLRIGNKHSEGIVEQMLMDQDRLCAIFDDLWENAPTSVGFIYLCDKYRGEIKEIRG